MFNKIKLPINKSERFIYNFFKKKGLDFFNSKLLNKKKIFKELIPPNLKDLYFLYQIIKINKRLTILEFGSGWPSIVMNIALAEIKKKHYNQVKHFPLNNIFELFILETEKKYLKISKDRIVNFYNKNKNTIKVNFFLSEIEMTTFDGKIVNQYKKLPTCNPDFIYIDGPSTDNINSKIRNFNNKNKSLPVMMSDVLQLEPYYNPGTIIVCDGRLHNAKFLKNNFQRNWQFNFLPKNDVSVFYLNDKPLSARNISQLNFYYRK